MSVPAFEERIHGSLVGAVIGAELGFGRAIHHERFADIQPQNVFQVKLEPAGAFQEERGRVTACSILPFIDLGVQAYLTAQGRVTPEIFAALLQDSTGIAAPAFAWDGVHTTQEVLKEGMHPRISGLGNAPCGLIAAAMPAVGIYHQSDPDYAYLDGVELASVTQPRLGADWAGLCAAAVAAAFSADASPDQIIDHTLRIMHQHNPDLFYKVNPAVSAANWFADSEERFAQWWLTAGAGESNRETYWIAPNPIRFVLPLLRQFSRDAQKFFALLISAPSLWGLDAATGGRPVSAAIGGAILGAMYGKETFPSEWLRWAEPIARAWYPLAGVVETRLQKEREIITVTEQLMQPAASDMSLLQEKIYGCMLAGAIGNAMGSPVECQMYWEIDAKYPDGITTILDPKRLESEDDNQMAMLLFETYLGRDGLPVMARHFGKTWYDRLDRDHFFPLCMGNAYDLIRQDWDPRIVGHWSVVTGSTVMCMEPVGVYHLADPEFAAIDATAISYMYQRGLDNVAATMLAATVAEALHPKATVDSVLQAALNAAPKEKLHSFDERPFYSAYDYIAACLDVADKYDDVLAVRKELYDRCLLYHMIDPLELWGFSLAMFKIAKGDVRLAAIGGTNIGRDSDTIAGRGAMLSGTLNGPASIPQEWIAMFKPESLERIRKNAGHLAEQIAIRKLGRLNRRQALMAGSAVK